MTQVSRGRTAVWALLVMLVAVGVAGALLWQDMLRRQEQGRGELLIQVRRAPAALIMFDLADKLGLKGDPVTEDYSRGMTYVRRSDPIAEYTIVYETDQSSQIIRSALGRISGCEARRGGAISLGESSDYRVTRKDGQRSYFDNDEEYLCGISGRRINIYFWFVAERPDSSEYQVYDRNGHWQTPDKTVVKLSTYWHNSEYVVP